MNKIFFIALLSFVSTSTFNAMDDLERQKDSEQRVELSSAEILVDLLPMIYELELIDPKSAEGLKILEMLKEIEARRRDIKPIHDRIIQIKSDINEAYRAEFNSSWMKSLSTETEFLAALPPKEKVKFSEKLEKFKQFQDEDRKNVERFKRISLKLISPR